jgi:hypothetical protein
MMLYCFGGGRKYLQEQISHNITSESPPPPQYNKPLIIKQLYASEIEKLYISQCFRILKIVK